MNSAKKRLTNIVEAYTKDFPEEFEMVRKAVEMKRRMTRDEFATVEGSSMRGLYEISETLQQLIIMGLEEEELLWLKTIPGGRWFATKFPVFALPESI